MNKNNYNKNIVERFTWLLKSKTFFDKNKDIIYCSVIVFLTSVIIGLSVMPEKNAEKITYNIISTEASVVSDNSSAQSDIRQTSADSEAQQSTEVYEPEDVFNPNSYSEASTAGMMMLINEESSSHSYYAAPQTSAKPSDLPSSSATPSKAPTTSTASGSSTSSKIKEGEPKININTAGEAQLIRLPGVGEATAKKIIAYRQQRGKFNNIKDIMKVSGIGDKKFQNMQQYITVD